MAEQPTTIKIEELVAAINTTGGKGASKLQWVSVVGVGTFLIVGIVPWMMYLISNVIPTNTKALVAIESQSDDVESTLASVEEELGRSRRAITKLSTLLQEEELESVEEPKP